MALTLSKEALKESLTADKAGAALTKIQDARVFKQMGTLLMIAGAVALGLFVFFWSQEPAYTPLYTGLDAKATAEATDMLRAAQIPAQTHAARHHPGEAPSVDVRFGDDSNVDVALLEDAVAGQQPVEIVDQLREFMAASADVVHELLRQILMHPARPEIGRMEPRARSALIEDHQLLALLEAPERRRQRADVHGLGRDVPGLRRDRLRRAGSRGGRHLSAGLRRRR